MSTLSEFQAAMQAADQAFSEVEEERRGLFRPDGGDRFAPQEMQERAERIERRRGEISAAVKEARTAVYAKLDEKAGQIGAQRTLLENDPSGWLGVPDRSKVSEVLPLLRAQAESMQLEQLADHLETVLAVGDTAAKVGWWLAAGPIRAGARARLAQLQTAGDESPSTLALAQQDYRLGSILEELKASSQPEKVRKSLEQYQAELNEIQKDREKVGGIRSSIENAQRSSIRF